MSKPFYHICIPPKTNWQTWILDCTTHNEALNIAKTIKLIESRVFLKRVPRDIWNMIVRLMFEHPLRQEPCKWGGNILYWLESWVCDSIQQIHNPLYSYNYTQWRIEDNPILKKCISDGDNGLTVNSVPFRVTLDDETVFVPRFGDLFLGIMVEDDDIAKIESVTMYISKQDIRQPFVFSSKYRVSITQLPTMELKYYYYCPGLKCVPLMCLTYALVECRIRVQKGTQSFPKLQYVYSYLGNSSQRDLVRISPHILNRNDKPNTFIVSQGYGCYQYLF